MSIVRFNQSLMANDVDSGICVAVAKNWWRRAIGLLLTPYLDERSGLWIEPCSSIHMLGMRYPIDVLFLDVTGRVMSFRDELKVCRFCFQSGAHVAVELHAGARKCANINVGDRLRIL